MSRVFDSGKDRLRLRFVFVLVILLSACSPRNEAPAPDPLAPFFRQEVGAPCNGNSECTTGLCDRMLYPAAGQDEAIGACGSIPFAIMPWQRAAIVNAMVSVVGDDADLRDRVLTFAAGVLEAPDAPISLRLLVLEAASHLLPKELGKDWEDRLSSLGGDWNLPQERFLAGIIRAGRAEPAEAVALLSESAMRGTEARRIRAARELATLCTEDAQPVLRELARDRESRFLRAAVLEGIAACPLSFRQPILDAAASEAMPYERARLKQLESP